MNPLFLIATGAAMMTIGLVSKLTMYKKPANTIPTDSIPTLSQVVIPLPPQQVPANVEKTGVDPDSSLGGE